jgi:hypothetical protein
MLNPLQIAEVTPPSRDRTVEAPTEDGFPVNRGGPKEKQKEPGMKAKRGTHTQAGQKKVAVARRREVTLRTDRQIVAARLARAIGRGHDAIYHGTRAPEKVLRSGKLIPSIGGVSFSRSPEEAAHFAYLMGSEADRWSPALLVLDRSSLKQVYRLEPYRDDEECDDDEREERVTGRTISFRRHLLGVVRESDVNNILGPRKLKFISPPDLLLKSRAFYEESRKLGERLVREGRARVRDIIIEERKRLNSENARSRVVSAVTSALPPARRSEAQRRCARRRR